MEYQIGATAPFSGLRLPHSAHSRKRGPAFEKLGPHPDRSLVAMVAYGLNDADIANYYSISEPSVRRLRTVYGICQEASKD